MKFDLLGLEDPVRREVPAVAVWRRFDRGVVLFHEAEAEAEAGGSLYVLMRAIRATTPDGDTVTLNVIGPGAAFGELSLLDPATALTATVQAIEPVQTLVLQAVFVVSNDVVRDAVARACDSLGVPWYGPTFDS